MPGVRSRLVTGYKLLNAVTVVGAGAPVGIPDGYDEALIAVVCGGTLAVTMEGSFDGGNTWYALPCKRLDNASNAFAANITATGTYAVDISGFRAFRATRTDAGASALTVQN